ncbi:ribonuclease D [Granulosicoccaceae sp. 1_MG-2023]|nr:ribonuclease D [Granulosicoccaceae sp. 1_MG-2023]
MTNEADNIELITDSARLAAFCEGLKQHSWIAVDTEFLREKTYKPKLCLIQVASPDSLACIDPLALDDLGPFLDVLYDRNITKVFHAAGQDLEIFYWMRGEVPGPLFDSQIAAPLLGENEQIGYGNLVKSRLGIELAKSHSRADWTRRPLPDVQLRYAADDVIYLARLYTEMRDELESRGRLNWLDDDFSALENPLLYNKPSSDMWLRVRGINKFRGKTLSAIQLLAEWREDTARDADLPRNWLMKDDVLIDIARQLPDSLKELGHIRGLSDGTVRRHGEKLVALVRQALERPPVPLPPFSKKSKLSPQADAIVELLSTLTKIRAAELDINDAVLAPRKELEKLLNDPSSSQLLHGWRRKLIGEQLQRLLDGQISMHIEDGEIRLQQRDV